MAKRNFWLGMLVMVLVFGMALIGCDSGSSDANYLDSLGLSTADPGPAVLTQFGFVDVDEFKQIRDAAGGFQGWAIDDEGYLVMAWTGRNTSDFDNVADEFDALFIQTDRGIESGLYYAEGNDYDVTFFPKKFSAEGFYVSAGTLLASIYL